MHSLCSSAGSVGLRPRQNQVQSRHNIHTYTRIHPADLDSLLHTSHFDLNDSFLSNYLLSASSIHCGRINAAMQMHTLVSGRRQ
ncbi:uncharacterized protein EI90DRAFT_3044939 [Cantharellus anzutake]|uniref:uncharacterized protein n=1 Tax=Cantharellus anzutake TaxID=1750568 RepID=UPI001905AB66|nr:uncharacterized protein EI90DRAFT_3044939 [Cantharellus anzutake]KAF8337112.1 hypothetical protein EI90DRAFT_3044939 [Cantharellus anzutake]